MNARTEKRWFRFRSRTVFVTMTLLFVVVAYVGAHCGLSWRSLNAMAIRVPGPRDVQASGGETQDGTENCVACQQLKVELPIDASAEEREAVMQELKRRDAANDAELNLAARAVAEQWIGCKFQTRAGQDSEQYTWQQDAASRLEAVEDAPQIRFDFFKCIVANDEFRLRGWQGVVTNVADTPGGRRIELDVYPSFMTAAGAPAFYHRAFHETWLLDKSGRLSLEKGEPGRGYGVVGIN